MDNTDVKINNLENSLAHYKELDKQGAKDIEGLEKELTTTQELIAGYKHDAGVYFDKASELEVELTTAKETSDEMNLISYEKVEKLAKGNGELQAKLDKLWEIYLRPYGIQKTKPQLKFLKEMEATLKPTEDK